MKKWLKLLIVIVTFAIISIGIYFGLNACGLTSINQIRQYITNCGAWGAIVYTVILILALVLLCFIPLLNTALTILGISLFGVNIAFVSNMIAIFFSTSILFFIGDKLGEKFAIKLVGKQTLENTQNLIDHKSKVLLPILFIIPGIPDEALCLVAGMTKMKYWYLLVVSLLYHFLEIGLFCFVGSGLIVWSTLTIFDWIIFINLLCIDLYFLFKLEKSIKK